MYKENSKSPAALVGPPVTIDLLPEQAFLEGVCFKPRPEGVVVDTIILHSCCVSEELATLGQEFIPTVFTEEAARSLAARWKQSGDPALEFAAIHTLIRSRRGLEGLDCYNSASIKDIFEFYGVSAHYLIERTGPVRQLVDPSLLAFHAGKSVMPRVEDGRSGISAFSVGIELLASKNSGYTEPQLQALKMLTDELMGRFPIANIYGHSDVAPGRKTDPDNFNWPDFIRSLNNAPKHSPIA